MKPVKTIKLRLTLDVEYVPGSTTAPFLEDQLHNAVYRAMGDGQLTCDSDAEVVEWTDKVSFVGYGKFTPEEEVA